MIYALRRADGGVSILRLIGEADLSAELAKWEAVADPAWLPVQAAPIDESDIPADRTFRDAWTHDGSINVDMPKAREVVRQRLREARAPKMAALDVESLRANEAKDAAKMTAIAARKQELRDITANVEIDEAQTAEALAATLADLKQSIEA